MPAWSTARTSRSSARRLPAPIPCTVTSFSISGIAGALRWTFHGPEGPLEVTVQSVFTVNDTDLLLEAALQGVGLVLLPESLAGDRLASGELRRTLEDWCKPAPGFYLYYPSKAHMPAPLRAFVDFVRMGKGRMLEA